MVTKGQHLKRFEAALAEHLGVKHAVCVSSCTTGLMLAYQCFGLTGEVIIPSFTFMATASSLVWAGLRPVFAEVNAAHHEPRSERRGAADHAPHQRDRRGPQLRQSRGDRGPPGDRRPARLQLIFDAAHGFGTLYQGSRSAGRARPQVYSMSPTKLLIAGEGGLVATNDDEVADELRMGREYGNSGNYDSAFAGINARMAEFNALMGLHSLRGLEQAAAAATRWRPSIARNWAKSPASRSRRSAR